jgi:hypothetical protein
VEYMNERLRIALDAVARPYRARAISEDGGVRTARFAAVGPASRFAHDAVWEGGGSARVERVGLKPELLCSFRRIAERAVEIRNETARTTQYEYNPTPVRPHERHYSATWPPTEITYHVASVVVGN